MERSVQDIIDGMKKQIAALEGQITITYPWKAGDMVILPADDQGHRRIIVVPNHQLAISNLAVYKGVELYQGEVPQCGYIVENRVHRAFTPIAEPVDESNAPPADFATNKPEPLDERGQTAAVMAVIPMLKAEDFTATHGHPSIAALKNIVGFDVQAPIRDAAWAMFKKVNPDWKPPVEPAA